MKIYIVRHGETEGNVEGITQGHTPGRLTEFGKQQAEAIAKRLAFDGVKNVVCSDLQRCVDTAAPFVCRNGISVEYEPLLRERSYGIFNGRPREEFRAWLEKQKMNQFSATPPEGESIYDVYRRVKQVTGEWVHGFPDTVYFTHGGPGALMVMDILNEGINSYDHRQLSNGSITLFDFDMGPEPRLFNSVDHLTRIEWIRSQGTTTNPKLPDDA